MGQRGRSSSQIGTGLPRSRGRARRSRWPSPAPEVWLSSRRPFHREHPDDPACWHPLCRLSDQHADRAAVLAPSPVCRGRSRKAEACQLLVGASSSMRAPRSSSAASASPECRWPSASRPGPRRGRRARGPHLRPRRPERQEVAGPERLADDRHARAGHAVEHRPVVGLREGHSKAACTGMVDQRFDHIDSGALSCTGERE